MEERKEITFSVRSADRRKLIQSFLAMFVGNFETEQKDLIIKISGSILDDDPKLAMESIASFLEYIGEYSDALSHLHDLVAEHMFVESKKTHLKFKLGEQMKMEEFNEAIRDQQEKDKEQKKEIKKKAAAKKKATAEKKQEK